MFPYLSNVGLSGWFWNVTQKNCGLKEGVWAHPLGQCEGLRHLEEAQNKTIAPSC